MHNDKTTREDRKKLWEKQSTLGDILFQIVLGIIIGIAFYFSVK